MRDVSLDGKSICLLVGPSRIYRWQLWLAQDLRGVGARVVLQRVAGRSGDTVSYKLLLSLEKMIFRLAGEQAFDLLDQGEAGAVPAGPSGEPYDILINFTTQEPDPAAARRIVTLTFDGIAGDVGAYAALLDGRKVEIRAFDSALANGCWVARPALEDKRVVSRSLANAFSRAAELLHRVVLGNVLLGHNAALCTFDDAATSAPATRDALSVRGGVAHVTGTVAEKISQRLKKIVVTGERWAIGWRWTSGIGLLDSGADQLALYDLIPDDGQRYFADPFIFEHQGKTFLFCEEYPYATQKGIISVMTIDADGTVSTPRVVLERPYHLSYPHVFERDGQIWMMPETGANRAVELYRAVNFPTDWAFERTLVSDLPAFDATIADHGGRLWMFLSTSYRQSSSWDNLHIYSAEGLMGEWRPHRKNTLMIDSEQSRPAGLVVQRGGHLLRPAQDGSRVYGGGMSICRIDRLDDEDFAQTVVAHISAIAPEGAYGAHTLNHSGKLEVVDVLGRLDIAAPTAHLAYRNVVSSALLRERRRQDRQSLDGNNEGDATRPRARRAI